MTLSNLLHNIVLKNVIGSIGIPISNIQFDSRKIVEGSVFVATRGTASDGHDYIEMAIENGAKAIVCEEIPTEQKGGINYIQVENSSAEASISERIRSVS